MEPRLVELAEDGEPDDELEAVLVTRGDLMPSVPTLARFGSVATCRLRRGQVAAVNRRPEVVYLNVGRRVSPALFEVCDDGAEAIAPLTRPRLGREGAGTVIAFLDWGADFTHRALRRADQSTRFQAIWDQRASGPPNRYGYGAIHSRAAINAALATADPFANLGYWPTGAEVPAHGTHVVDIAAGRNGLARAAELLFVHLASSHPGDSGDLGDSVRILEALDFVLRAAGDRPLVVNMSLGSTGGSHIGRSPVELAIDHIVTAAPGRAIVQSAGNYRKWRTHAEGKLASGARRDLEWIVSAGDPTPNELEVWFGPADEIGVELISPFGDRFIVRRGEHRTISIDGERIGRLHHDAPEALSGDQRVIAFLLPEAPTGSWLVRLAAGAIVDGRYHAWIERDSAARDAQSRFAEGDAAESSTVGTIATSKHGIAVGAIDTRAGSSVLASFSSIGPSRDSRIKPDLVAPGVAIRAARSATRRLAEGLEDTVSMSGTSMASPHVAGCVALLFAEALPNRLSIAETRRLLLRSARSLPDYKPEMIGHGLVDLESTLAAVSATRTARRTKMNEARDLCDQLAPSADSLFEAIADGALSDDRFDVIGRPGELLGGALSTNDLVVEVAPGESIGGSVYRVADAYRLEERSVADFENATGQSWNGSLLDADGRLTDYQAVLRPRSAQSVVPEFLPEFLPDLSAWADLMSFVPPTALTRRLTASRGHVLTVASGYGPLNLDFYPVRVERLPSTVGSPEQLLGEIRLNLNRLVNRSLAQFYPASPVDARTWRSSRPEGALIHIDMADDGSVLCSQASARHWRFSTVFTRSDLNHPVCGNREWGFQEADGGGWIFYTRGADRVTRLLTAPAFPAIYFGGHQLWLSLQAGMVRAVNGAGGAARALPATHRQHSWSEVAASGYYRGARGSGPAATPLPRVAAEGATAELGADQAAAAIPLSPTHGGRSIDTNMLELADIIVSTTTAAISGAIRQVTGGPVSHAMLYVGDGLVVEAIGSGVTLRPIGEALADASLAVAARYERLTSLQALRARDFAGRQIGRPFNVAGLVVPGSFRLYRRLFGDRAGAIRVDLGRGRDDSFFCSQLVLSAFEAAGVPLTQMRPGQAAPSDIAQLILSERLSYLGHLRA